MKLLVQCRMKLYTLKRIHKTLANEGINVKHCINYGWSTLDEREREALSNCGFNFFVKRT